MCACSAEPVTYDESQARLFNVTAANGVKHACELPHVSAMDNPHDGYAVDTLEDMDSEALSDEIDSYRAANTPESILDLSGDWCAYRIEDWWTYEVCYKKLARQYHSENGKVLEEYSLGNYSASESSMSVVSVDINAAGGEQRYVMQKYLKGAPCELTGAPRTAEVRFVCGPTSQPTITEVAEPVSCGYLMTVTTSRLCKHPSFVTVPSKPKRILCHQLK
jgi:protein OS-9